MSWSFLFLHNGNKLVEKVPKCNDQVLDSFEEYLTKFNSDMALRLNFLTSFDQGDHIWIVE